MTVMSSAEFVKKIIDVAKNYKTLYVMDCFGAPMNTANKKRYCNNDKYNKDADRQKMINAASTDTFGFDCVNLIKGVLWGWKGDKSKTYGGAKYKANGVPDIGANEMINVCSNISTDFSKIEVGEVVWCTGHIGVYIGNGLAVECTPKWENKVQITACNCTKNGYNRRNWTKHGKLPYIDYKAEKTAEKTPTSTVAKPIVTSNIVAGDIVTIKKGAKYGGSAKGKTVPTAQLAPKKHTVAKVQTNNGVVEALLQGINSWVAVADLTFAGVTKGCKVKIKKGARTYEGKSVAGWVYSKEYTVDELNGKRAVLDKRGICTAFHIDDLIVQ